MLNNNFEKKGHNNIKALHIKLLCLIKINTVQYVRDLYNEII